MSKDNKVYQILVADDNRENLRVLSTILADEGYQVRVVQNGVQTIESIKANEPDILLLDVHMPEMDGYEVAKKLKGDEIHSMIPIMFLSALNDSFNKKQAFLAGGDDYIAKPFDVDEIIARIRIHIKHRETMLENIRLKDEIDSLRKLL